MSIIESISNLLNTDSTEAEMIYNKAIAGGEINSIIDANTWFENRFRPNIVFVDEEGYSKMCIDALKIVGSTAATDYGSSRQRDLGQLWADMTRGYLGEYAFQIFLKNKFNLDSKLGHEVGNIDEYLPQDIHSIKETNGEFRSPNINIGIKTSKWNSIWLDIPGDQFNHSDISVFIKVGTGRDHLFSFFKKLSVFKDKVLKKGVSVGVLTEQESEHIYNSLPDLVAVPAYICGFVKKDSNYAELSYGGKKGRKNYTIKSWNGPRSINDLETIKQREGITGSVNFEGINKFSHDSGYLFNTGNLLWQESDWTSIRERF